MGKSRNIKIIAGYIGKITAHKLLIKYGNNPEAVHHMESEITNYRGNSSDFIAEYNWSEYDKEKIRREAEKSVKKELKRKHFEGIKYPESEINPAFTLTLKEVLPE